MSGGGGNDTLDGGAGADSLVGGAGDDWFYVDSATDTVSENAGEGTDLVRASVTYTLSDADVENLTLAGSAAINGTGNAGDNTLVGNTGANVLQGAAGSDSLSGGSGNDSLYGGAGNDTLSGGNGTDGFVFNTALGSSNVDDVLDFTPGTDGIGLENAIFTTLAVGALPAAAFYAGSAAHDSSDRIIFNAGTGALYYDADGSGFLHLQVQFATLDRGLTLAADDFLVV
ncbi:MAG: calcium-binding protein [Rhodocyclaceae bacterium]|nr:calcium-binding protein [Rhodocyclaceae bacterium]